MLRSDIALEDEHIDKIRQFVDLYSVFHNDMEFPDPLDENEKILFDWLKKYKLASSEGLNKYANRMIRYNVMKDFIFKISDSLLVAEQTLTDKMLAVIYASNESA